MVVGVDSGGVVDCLFVCLFVLKVDGEGRRASKSFQT